MFDIKSANKVTPSSVKQHNESLILRAIYAHDTISRVQLAALTNLSRPSVTELTQGLMRRGLIQKVGVEQVVDKVGKKPTLLAFNPDAFQLIVIVVGDTELIGRLVNLRMQTIEQATQPLHDTVGAELVDLLLNLAKSLVEKASKPLLGVSIGTPGIVDSTTGVVHLATNLKWLELDLADLVSAHVQLPVYVGNDSNLAAVGEYRFGVGQGIEDLIVVRVGTGIGAGILADGRVVQGNVFGAGELGHVPFLNLDNQCICGRRGCLETMVSIWGIIKQAKHKALEHPNSLLNQLTSNGANGDMTIEVILEALRQGDPDAVELVRTAGTYLGQALITVVHLLNPRQIILTGSLVRLGDVFFNEIRHMVEERAFTYISTKTDVIQTKLGDDSILLGAGAMLLEKELGL
jgi:N-acetylglucosamine repressor